MDSGCSGRFLLRSLPLEATCDGTGVEVPLTGAMERLLEILLDDKLTLDLKALIWF